jgi:hypothetical protein
MSARSARQQAGSISMAQRVRNEVYSGPWQWGISIRRGPWAMHVGEEAPGEGIGEEGGGAGRGHGRRGSPGVKHPGHGFVLF